MTALAAAAAVVITIILFVQNTQEDDAGFDGWYVLGGGMFVFAVIPWCLSLPFQGRKRVVARTILTCAFTAALIVVAHFLGLMPTRNP